jgi:hypothetical protein
MSSFLRPVSSHVLNHLDIARARRLLVWSANHGSIFDMRTRFPFWHSLKTCPFLAYIPAYLRHDRKGAEWAEWLYEFYRNKHKEEGGCACDAQI